jgi:hypothetical protein
MTYSLDEIKDMLDALPMAKFRFDLVKEDTLTKTGALRTDEGQNVIEPSPESASMVIGLRASIDFLTAAPEIIKQLLDTMEHNEQVASMIKPPELPEPDEDIVTTLEEKPKRASKPETGANKPISV